MDCEAVASRLTDLMEGDLNDADEAAALEHLASCARCEAVLSDTRSVTELARSHGRVDLSDADRDRMLGALLSRLDEREP